mmetsp:Transcript_8778/g.16802  ORF Transcript_8778/g.16802 Transcript_8778/m.16802 type:complete len:351 (-) Transcript_8778:315-1367(-)
MGIPQGCRNFTRKEWLFFIPLVLGLLVLNIVFGVQSMQKYLAAQATPATKSIREMVDDFPPFELLICNVKEFGSTKAYNLKKCSLVSIPPNGTMNEVHHNCSTFVKENQTASIFVATTHKCFSVSFNGSEALLPLKRYKAGGTVHRLEMTFASHASQVCIGLLRSQTGTESVLTLTHNTEYSLTAEIAQRNKLTGLRSPKFKNSTLLTPRLIPSPTSLTSNEIKILLQMPTFSTFLVSRTEEYIAYDLGDLFSSVSAVLSVSVTVLGLFYPNTSRAGDERMCRCAPRRKRVQNLDKEPAPVPVFLSSGNVNVAVVPSAEPAHPTKESEHQSQKHTIRNALHDVVDSFDIQ